MKKIATISTTLILITTLLTGCQSATRQDLGMIAGGVAGGAAGNVLSNGSALGTVAGAVGGAYVGNQLAR